MLLLWCGVGVAMIVNAILVVVGVVAAWCCCRVVASSLCVGVVAVLRLFVVR